MKKTDSELLHSTTTIRLLNIDSFGSEEILLEKMGCFLKVINRNLQLWSLETDDGAFILGIGNPFQKEAYRESLWELIHLKQRDEFFSWFTGFFKEYVPCDREPILLRMEYTTRFTRTSDGAWRLFFPYDSYYMGETGRPVLPAHSDNSLSPTGYRRTGSSRKTIEDRSDRPRYSFFGRIL